MILRPAPVYPSPQIIPTKIPVVNSTPTRVPSPTPLPLLYTQTLKVINLDEGSYSITIPAGSAYKTDGQFPLYIYPTSNLVIEVCYGCQSFNSQTYCGDDFASDSPRNCTSSPVIISGIKMEAYYLKKNNQLAFIEGPYYSGLDFYTIRTVNQNPLTQSETQIISAMLSTIRRSNQ